MIKYAEYPSSLPLPQSNFSGSYSTPTSQTQFTSGVIRKRKIGRTSVKRATLEWLFTPEEYDIWEMFFRDYLSDGCDKFTINMCSGGDLQSGPHVVQCVGDGYNFTYEECNWRVSIECILYPFPRGDEAVLIEEILGGKVSEFTEILNMYYERGHLK